ncbi:MAG: hypothetical protein M3Q40_08405 [Pseudomonadota bacterium]|nr:hypothetical protein [Pseudomonadota bacterium]
MIPPLPCAQIRQALERDDWDAAAALLSAHEAELRLALAGAPDPANHAPLLALAQAQRAFIQELKSTRDESARALESLGKERRGVQAYLGAGR